MHDVTIFDVTIFEYESNPVRSILINGKPWFVAKDVCEILGLNNVTNATAKIPKKHLALNSIKGKRGEYKVNTVDEPGLYRLVLRSKKPEAEPFIEWVTAEVLPAIRKTGSYSIGNKRPAANKSSSITAFPVVIYKETPCITTKTLAMVTGTSVNNTKLYRSKCVDGVDFHIVSGADLADLKLRYPHAVVNKICSRLSLWTRDGLEAVSRIIMHPEMLKPAIDALDAANTQPGNTSSPVVSDHQHPAKTTKRTEIGTVPVSAMALRGVDATAETVKKYRADLLDARDRVIDAVADFDRAYAMIHDALSDLPFHAGNVVAKRNNKSVTCTGEELPW